MRIRGVAAERLLFLLFMWNTTELLRMAYLAFQSTSAILLYRLAVHFVHSKVSYSLLIYESFLGMTLLFAFWRSGASVWILGSGVLVGCYCFQHVFRGTITNDLTRNRNLTLKLKVYLGSVLSLENKWWKWGRFAAYNIIVWGLAFLLMVIPASAGEIKFLPGAT